jgi:hypothetical protein
LGAPLPGADVSTALGEGGTEKTHPCRDAGAQPSWTQGIPDDVLDEAVEGQGPIAALDQRVPAEDAAEGHEVAQVWGMEGSSGALNAISSVSSQLSTHRPTCEGPAEPDVLLRQDDGQDRVIR